MTQVGTGQRRRSVRDVVDGHLKAGGPAVGDGGVETLRLQVGDRVGRVVCTGQMGVGATNLQQAVGGGTGGFGDRG